MTQASDLRRISTGVSGLDQLLDGGFPERELYLIAGGPGTGKTTLGLQFLLEGRRLGENALYFTLSQTEESLRRMAASHGFDLTGIHIHAYASGTPATLLEQTIFHTAEVELDETVQQITEVVERHQPARMVFDSVAELRLLAESPLRYRRQIVLLRQLLTGRGCTVLFLDDDRAEDNALEGLTNGVLRLCQASPKYGDVRRHLEVIKMRGTGFRGGLHDFRIMTGGLVVFPRLETSKALGEGRHGLISSGIQELDALLGGGMEEGTSCAIIGPAGAGKTSLATLYAYAALQRGERAAIYLFDERAEIFLRRSQSLGMDVRAAMEAGTVHLRQVGTGELSSGEFAHSVRREVETNGVDVVLIDTLTGYVNAMAEDRVLIAQMHELLSYLSRHGVLSLLVVAQHGVGGSDTSPAVDISYMADMVVLLRYFEAAGALRKAISVVKKRYGDHERSIRELSMRQGGIHIGSPIREFRGILSGSPTFEGSAKQLFSGDFVQEIGG